MAGVRSRQLSVFSRGAAALEVRLGSFLILNSAFLIHPSSQHCQTGGGVNLAMLALFDWRSPQAIFMGQNKRNLATLAMLTSAENEPIGLLSDALCAGPVRRLRDRFSTGRPVTNRSHRRDACATHKAELCTPPDPTIL
jgi:hypothetical protein